MSEGVFGRAGLSRRDLLRMSAVMSAGVGLPVLAGCGGGSPAGSVGASSGPVLSGADLVQAAMKEKTVKLYTLDQRLADLLAAGFKQQYSWADVQTVVGSPGDVSNRVLTESVSGADTADVVTLSQGLRQALLSNNAVRPVKIEGDAKLPSTLVDSTNYAHPFYLFVVIYAYNTTLVDSAPPDVQSLSDPKWHGKIAVDPPANAANTAVMLASRKNALGSGWQDWLKQVQQNDLLVANSASAALQQVLQGERAVSVNSHQDVLALPKDSPVKPGYYPDLIPITICAWLTAKGKHPHAGQLFVEWLVSEPGQRATASSGRAPVLEIDTPASLSNVLPAGYTLMPTSQVGDFYNNPKPYVDLYRQLWPS